MPIIKIPEILRQKLSDNGADALVDLLSEVEKSSRDSTVVLVEEKFERRLTEEISKLDKRITEEISKLDKRITEEISRLRSEFVERISQSELKIVRWLVVLWLTQMAAILGTFLKIK